MLIFFRVVQGAVSGPMIPLSQSILLANYPVHKKSFATSIWTMTARSRAHFWAYSRWVDHRSIYLALDFLY